MATTTEFLVAAVLAVALVGTLGPWPAPAIVVGVLALSAAGRALTRTPHPEPASIGAEIGPIPDRPDTGLADHPVSVSATRPVSSASR
jgi:hypothetical protein